jgi:hypothetical protein
MKRAEFLKVMGGGTLVAVAGSLATACKSSTTPTPGTSDTKDFISTTVDGHSHTVTLKKTEVQTPPAGGISRSTATTNNHYHSFTMSATELTQVNNGTPVEVTTGNADTDLHHHVFHITSWFW